MDFNPIYPQDNNNGFEPPQEVPKEETLNILNEDKSLSVLNLPNLASAHIIDFEENRKVAKKLTKELSEESFKMSIKEKIEFLKVTARLVEINAKALMNVYTIGMRTELAKQFLLAGSKDEKSIRNITPRVNNLLNLLKQTDGKNAL